jgi:hypothetical protein
MAFGWNGPDPVADSFPTPQEVGTEYRAEVDITIASVRVWTDAAELNQATRKARIWTTTGGQLGIASLPEDLPPGWSVHDLDAPVERLAGQKFIVSFSTGGNEGFANHALDNDVPSSDGSVTALGFAGATNGNGVANTSPGTFPTVGSAGHHFYGVDVVYTLGIGGNTAPTITQFTVEADAAVATAIVVATDAETLVGATYRYDWGDGSAVTVSSSATAQHTYDESGLYAVLASVTDAEGLADHAAAAVDVVVPSGDVLGLDAVDIFDQVTSHAYRLGIFNQVTGHEPKSAPGNGLFASFWVRGIRPLALVSGLNATGVRLELSVRIGVNMLQDPQDEIDPDILAAVSALMTAYSGDFTLGGRIRNVDLLAAHGLGLSAEAGYLNQDGKQLRVMVVTLPLILNDVFPQEA